MERTVQVSKCFICAALLALLQLGYTLAQPRAPLRKSFDIRVPWIPTPVKVMGKLQLVYELALTNFSNDELALSRIEVVDLGSGTVLGDFRGAELEGLIGRIDGSAGQKAKVSIPPAVRAVVYLSVPITSADKLPRGLKHRIEYDDIHATGREHAILEGGTFMVRDERRSPLGPPLRGGPWIAIYDFSWERGHRRVQYAVNGAVHIPGRFAIDWIKLDEHGKYAAGDSSKLASWFGYGAEVLAVADATVAAAIDDMAERPIVSAGAGAKVTLANDSGNYVALDLGDGRYAFFEHLKPGSIRVKLGERVWRGETIGLLGYTGESTGPHLHLHVSDANATLDAEGVPYAFQNFRLLGAFPSIEAFAQGQAWQPLRDGTDANRSAELPGRLAVVEFPPS